MFFITTNTCFVLLICLMILSPQSTKTHSLHPHDNRICRVGVGGGRQTKARRELVFVTCAPPRHISLTPLVPETMMMENLVFLEHYKLMQ